MRRIVISGLVALAAGLGSASAAAATPAPARTVAQAVVTPSWMRAEAAGPGGFFFFSAGSNISCGSPKTCLAIGTRYQRWVGHLNPVRRGVERNGVEAGRRADAEGGKRPRADRRVLPVSSKWTLHTASVPARSELAVLSGVSCATSAYCVLAGEFFLASGADQPYLDVWNGTKLTTMKAPVVGGSTTAAEATDVSCAVPSSCAVSGVLISETASLTITGFTEIWNGQAWRTAMVPWPKGTAGSFLVGVSCHAARACVAVGMTGADTNSPHAAAAYYDGTSWKVQTVPAPAKGKKNAFADVRCLSATRCLAIGVTGAAKLATMTGVWRGAAWRLDPGF